MLMILAALSEFSMAAVIHVVAGLVNVQPGGVYTSEQYVSQVTRLYTEVAKTLSNFAYNAKP